MLSTLKSWLLSGLAVALGIMSALAFWRKAQLEQAKADAQEAARKTEQKAVKKLVEGLGNEAESARLYVARRRKLHKSPDKP